MSLNDGFRRMSVNAATALGSPWLFVVNVLLILVWLGAGPFTGFSDTWQLVVNTATTVFTYLAVFLIQNTQNRGAKAMHLKLDELISSISGARNHLINLENLSDEELEKIQLQFKQLKQKTRSEKRDALRAIADELDQQADEYAEEDEEETVVTAKQKSS
jgi:low affinity Fe/Cu permease